MEQRTFSTGSGPSHSYENDEQIFEQLGPPKFTCFNQLPKEIRLMIWRQSFFGRIVVIKSDHLHLNNCDINAQDFFKKESPESPITISSAGPATMRVNRESRKESLRHYENVMKKGLRMQEWGVSGRKFLYFNPAIDSLGFADFTPAEQQRHLRPQLKNLASSLQPESSSSGVAKLSTNLFRIRLVRSIVLRAEFPGWNRHSFIVRLIYLAIRYHGLEEIILMKTKTDPELSTVDGSFDLQIQRDPLVRFLRSRFEREKHRNPDFTIPRVRIWLIDENAELPLYRDELADHMGGGQYEDSTLGGSWTRWFESPY